MKTPPLQQKIREARKSRHFTQAQLAKRVGCAQTTICSLEKGVLDAVSDETLTKVLEEVGLSARDAEGVDAEHTPSEAEVLAFCPSYDCPTALSVVVLGKLAIRPTMFRVLQGTAPLYCKVCGSVLDFGCMACMTPLVEGASFCMGCGSALVKIPLHLERVDPEEHAQTMTGRLRAYLETRVPIEAGPRPVLPNNITAPAP